MVLFQVARQFDGENPSQCDPSIPQKVALSRLELGSIGLFHGLLVNLNPEVGGNNIQYLLLWPDTLLPHQGRFHRPTNRVISVVEFQREGYKISKILGYKSIFQKEIIVFGELMQQRVIKKCKNLTFKVIFQCQK